MAREWWEDEIKKYKSACKNSKKGTRWLLSDEHARELFDGPCNYCGQSCSRYSGERCINGIDRLYSDEHYEEGNVVSCCKTCNRMKLDMDPDTFFIQVIQICRHSIPQDDVYGSQAYHRVWKIGTGVESPFKDLRFRRREPGDTSQVELEQRLIKAVPKSKSTLKSTGNH